VCVGRCRSTHHRVAGREGIGRLLLARLVEASEPEGHAALSLSVNVANPARRLYASVGFRTVETRESGMTMVRRASSLLTSRTRRVTVTA
jgi:ribosomal protein S18 acetylase RimI-like enzyme